MRRENPVHTDAFDTAFRRHPKSNVEKAYSHQQSLNDVAATSAFDTQVGDEATVEVTAEDAFQALKNDENPESLAGSSISLNYSEDCKIRESCG